MAPAGTQRADLAARTLPRSPLRRQDRPSPAALQPPLHRPKVGGPKPGSSRSHLSYLRPFVVCRRAFPAEFTVRIAQMSIWTRSDLSFVSITATNTATVIYERQ